MSDGFDPTTLAVDAQLPSFPRQKRYPATHGPGQFLKGPISMPWLEKAARLPGRALHVALAVRHQSALKRSSTVTLPNKQLVEFGVDRDTKRRGLAALEAAGLLIVERKPGRNPIVTIVEVSELVRSG